MTRGRAKDLVLATLVAGFLLLAADAFVEYVKLQSLSAKTQHVASSANTKAIKAVHRTTVIRRYIQGYPEPGLPGKNGGRGQQGPRGVGQQGPRGFNGFNGHDGAAGQQGPQGPPGDVTDEQVRAAVTAFCGVSACSGPAGPEGPAGPAGIPGATGPAGPEPVSFTFTYQADTYVCTDPAATGNYTCTPSP